MQPSGSVIGQVNDQLRAYANNLSNDPQLQKNALKASKILIADLEQQPWSIDRDELIQKTKKGIYSDIMSTIQTPKIQLIIDLEAAGFNELVPNVMNGKYDD